MFSGNINTASTDADGGRQYMIKTNSKGKYVKADRIVVKGRTPEEWGESVKKYINDKIRQASWEIRCLKKSDNDKPDTCL